MNFSAHLECSSERKLFSTYITNSVALARERTIPTKQPPLVGEVSANFVDRGCCVVSTTDPYGRILGFLDRSSYLFFQVALRLYSRGWVDPVPDPLLVRKSRSVVDRTRDLLICSQELWPLDHRGGRFQHTLYRKLWYFMPSTLFLRHAAFVIIKQTWESVPRLLLYANISKTVQLRIRTGLPKTLITITVAIRMFLPWCVYCGNVEDGSKTLASLCASSWNCHF
jgi:hypothetical protein